MGLKQYKSGKKFEEELCWWLSKKDYFVIYNEKRSIWESMLRYSDNKK